MDHWFGIVAQAIEALPFWVAQLTLQFLANWLWRAIVLSRNGPPKESEAVESCECVTRDWFMQKFDNVASSQGCWLYPAHPSLGDSGTGNWSIAFLSRSVDSSVPGQLAMTCHCTFEKWTAKRKWGNLCSPCFENSPDGWLPNKLRSPMPWV